VLYKNTVKEYFNYKFQLQITKYIFKVGLFQLLLSITLDPKYKILLTKVNEMQNTFRSHFESISQSMNE